MLGCNRHIIIKSLLCEQDTIVPHEYSVIKNQIYRFPTEYEASIHFLIKNKCYLKQQIQINIPIILE